MTNYSLLTSQLDALIDSEPDALANAANTVALLYNSLDDINWVGFYVLRGDELVLGPFQGNTACVHIGMGKGVCGTSAQKKETILVPDVDQFPGHIACSSASRSEIVVPVMKDGVCTGVLDVDSDQLDDFDEVDQRYLEELVKLLV